MTRAAIYSIVTRRPSTEPPDGRAALSIERLRLVAILNEIFADFDNIADSRGLEKIKTIGDAYMAAAGLPFPADDHAVRAAHMALDMIESLAHFNKRSGYNLQLRVGINSGAVVAGVIGRRKFIYDLWGDAVNIASRMESQGVAGRVQVTEATRQQLAEPFVLEQRGTIAAKGLGELHTWFLVGRSGQPPLIKFARKLGQSDRTSACRLRPSCAAPCQPLQPYQNRTPARATSQIMREHNQAAGPFKWSFRGYPLQIGAS